MQSYPAVLPLAPRWRRVAAWLLDLLLVTIVWIPLLLLTPDLLLAKVLVGSSHFIALLFRDALPGGQSPGKRALGIAVADQRGGWACTPTQSALRHLTEILGFVDWLFIVGPTRRRLGDRLAGTHVVMAPSR